MLVNRLIKETPSLTKPKATNKILPNYSSQDVERKRIARELHDSIGSLLSTTILLFDTVKPVNEERYKEVRELLSETQIELRRIVFNLMPATLEKLGLIPAIQQLCDYLNKSEQFEINFDCEKWISPVSKYDMETHIYRIIQELFQNAVKHSKATALNLELAQSKNRIKISLSDNGIGFAKINKENMSLDTRVTYLGGDLNIIQLDRGTKVIIDLPLDKNQ